jgi:spermidine synthase
MPKISLLTGTILKEVVDSPINGEIRVSKSLAFGTHIQVENLTQSGGVLYWIWEKTVKKIKRLLPEVDKCLVLGLGGGSIAKIIRKYWPDAGITGVDIDPIMVSLGKKYLGLGNVEVKIVIKDAYEFVTKTARANSSIKYDLIFVDLYIGDEFPNKFQSLKFLRSVRKIMSKNGICVFNRLYFGEKRKESIIFSETLKKVFSEVEMFFPQANVMLICFV